MSDYWRWNASDLLNNTLRGSYCEFIVSAALGIDLSGTNDDWTPYDISFPYNWVCNGEARDEVRIEVKSCAYLQAWRQGDGRLSNIQFSIRPTRAWDSISGYAEEVKRQSDVYVFCLYTETVRERGRPVGTGWMGLLHRTNSYSGRAVWPSEDHLAHYAAKSLDPYLVQTMTASVMPLSIRWMCTPPTFCIISIIPFVHNRKAAPHYARSCFFFSYHYLLEVSQWAMW
ncbi:MAG: hypothetical protein ACLUGP_03805 [Faecalibacterium prausnitzii]